MTVRGLILGLPLISLGVIARQGSGLVRPI
jgi:hypothetical protein